LVRQILIERGELKEDDDPMKYEIDDFETKITEEEIE
jgi:small subunit ribosomal protein S2